MKKKLQRDTEEGKVGGVCSGIANYLGSDPVVVRLFFVLVTVVFYVGLGVITYLICWIVMPEKR